MGFNYIVKTILYNKIRSLKSINLYFIISLVKSDIWSYLIPGVNLPRIGLITDNKSAYVSSDTLVREILAAYRIF